MAEAAPAPPGPGRDARARTALLLLPGIGLGAGLSALAGALLTPGSGATPLLWLMVVTGVGAILTILMVIRREKRLAGAL